MKLLDPENCKYDYEMSTLLIFDRSLAHFLPEPSTLMQ